MINAIGSSSSSPAPDKTSGAAALAAELARYQRQLSDCVNCSSANTPQSRAKAQALSDKIAATRTQIEKVTTPDTSNAPGVVQNNQSATNSSTNNASNSTSASLENNVNIFA